MTKPRSLTLVVDASVLRSAGETEHPVSRACRETLNGILTICHRTVLTPALTEERKRHASRFSRKWLRSMFAHRKVVPSLAPPPVEVDTDALTPGEQKALNKDQCLLAAAMAHDQAIVTCDKELKTILGKTRKGARLLHDIRWVNPVSGGVQALRELARA